MFVDIADDGHAVVIIGEVPVLAPFVLIVVKIKQTQVALPEHHFSRGTLNLKNITLVDITPVSIGDAGELHQFNICQVTAS